MPRPKNKTELIDQSRKSFDALLTFVNNLSDDEKIKEFPPGTMNRNIRDVLVHLHEWHIMMISWYETGKRGEKPDMPATGYTWKTTAELNKNIRDANNSVPLHKILSRLTDSHEEVTKIIHSHSNEELFDKKRYLWTGTTSLGAYLISSTSSHYDWALRLIKNQKKTNYVKIAGLDKYF